MEIDQMIAENNENKQKIVFKKFKSTFL